MCGIAGLVDRSGRWPDRALLTRMADRIRHRGPDEDGCLVRSGCGLAFRRLRVIDLATGSQPQSNENGSVHVVFNGEIYNYRDLRERLIARGHRFQTSSDTEVLVHLYEEKGVDLVHELNGMFAFAIWDQRARKLVLARDRLGVKPLLWAPTPEGIAFASEAGSLLEVPGIDQRIDPDAVHHYLSWGAVPAPRTMRLGIKRLPPAHLLTWQDGFIETREYWHPLETDVVAPASYDEGKRRLRSLLEDSVRLRLAADVPLGAFLSGGVDSTTIAGLMARRGSDVHTFSIGFADDPTFDETRYAREAAAYHRTQHTETQLSAADLREAIPSILDALSEPFGGASLLPTFAVSQETRRAMTVALSGDGADELFAGYDKYLGEIYRRWYGQLPAGLRDGILGPLIRALPASRASRAGELGRKARRLVDGMATDPAERHERWMRFASAEDVSRLLGQERVTNPGLEVVRAVHADYDGHGLADPVNRMLFTDLRIALPTDMLLKVDTASMLNSLEVREPFLDYRIVELAMSMPGEWKMSGGSRKRILKDTVRDLLPPGIQRRPKAGFDVPIGEWLKSDLRELFWDTVSAKGDIPLDTGLLERWYEEHRRGRADRTKVLWAAFTLRWWETRVRGGAPAARSVARAAPENADTSPEAVEAA